MHTRAADDDVRLAAGTPEYRPHGGATDSARPAEPRLALCPFYLSSVIATFAPPVDATQSHKKAWHAAGDDAGEDTGDDARETTRNEK